MDFFSRLAKTVLRRRWWLVALALAACLVAAAGAARLTPDFSVRAFFLSDDPEAQGFEEISAFWGQDDAVMLLVVTCPEGPLLTPQRLRALQAAVEEIAAQEAVADVQAITEVTRVWAEIPGLLQLDPLLDTMPQAEDPQDPRFVAWRDEVLRDPMWVPSLLAPDGSAAGVMVEFATGSDDILALMPLVRQLRAALARHAEGELAFAEAGIPALRADFFTVFYRDNAILAPLAMLLIAVCLLLVFRNLHGVLIPSLGAALPTLLVLGAMGLLGEPLGMLNQSYLTLLPAIAVADAIHLVSRFHEELRRRAAPGQRPTADQRNAATAVALSRVGAACLLTSLTTGAGLLSLQMARMPILQSFGRYAALGILLAYLVLLFVVPVLLSFTRGAAPEAGREERPGRIDRLLLACAGISLHHPWRVLAATLTVVAMAGFFGSRVVVDNQITRLLHDDHPTTRASRLADQKLGGILLAEIDLQGAPGSLKEPATLRALEALGRQALALEGVRAVASPATVVSRVADMLTGDPAIPDSVAAVSQFLLLMEGDEALSQVVDADYGRGRVLIRARDEGSNRFAELAGGLQGAMEIHLGSLPLQARLSGTPHVAYRGFNHVTCDLRNSLLLAFMVIGLLIGLLLRDLRLAAICFLPNALPLLVGYGLMGAAGWRLEPTSAMVFTVALGIAVDDTIHLLVRWREERRRGHGMEQAIRLAVLHSGRAVVITSLILCCGFLVHLLGSFPNMVVMGSVGAAVIATALLCDLFVLPSLLRLFGERATPRRAPRAE